MQDIAAETDWLAVGTSFVLAYLLGFVWYGFLFNRAWVSGHGLSGPPASMPVAAMTLQALGTFGLAWLFGIGMAHAMPATMVLIVLTIVCLMAAGAFYTMKPARVAAIEGGYVVAMAVLIAVVQALL